MTQLAEAPRTGRAPQALRASKAREEGALDRGGVRLGLPMHQRHGDVVLMPAETIVEVDDGRFLAAAITAPSRSSSVTERSVSISGKTGVIRSAVRDLQAVSAAPSLRSR
jgi:hypothetical protein